MLGSSESEIRCCIERLCPISAKGRSEAAQGDAAQPGAPADPDDGAALLGRTGGGHDGRRAAAAVAPAALCRRGRGGSCRLEDGCRLCRARHSAPGGAPPAPAAAAPLAAAAAPPVRGAAAGLVAAAAPAAAAAAPPRGDGGGRRVGGPMLVVSGLPWPACVSRKSGAPPANVILLLPLVEL